MCSTALILMEEHVIVEFDVFDVAVFADGGSDFDVAG